ncbi:hypothetical protein [Nocardia pseudovaccinii]|uniref:hypothetical protein n=1 Tax=Nocardia pseudovaccinii TaxID=189540 RepID=UPI0007A37A96|nr:hypothetical protein [Nocardia pseudovaccinii]
MIENDDLLHRVDPHYLGPAGHTMPLRIRYQAAGVGFVVFTTVFVIARAVLHAPLGFRSLMVMLLLTIYFTTRLTRYINADRPLRSVVRAAWNDLIAPRPPKTGKALSIRLPAPAHRTSRAPAATEHSLSTPTQGELR